MTGSSFPSRAIVVRLREYCIKFSPWERLQRTERKRGRDKEERDDGSF
jgi:hypothetical protein